MLIAGLGVDTFRGVAEVEEEHEKSAGKAEELKATLHRAVQMAAEDPDAFVAECRAIGRRFGMSLEQVYEQLQQDPEMARIIGRDVLKRTLQEGARRLKARLGI